ncbi:MAG: TraB/GumN family protein [Gammaproteobacteria bacterium]|nr:TraB/GumN family protein [Gammaproteobacteria bacterium]
MIDSMRVRENFAIRAITHRRRWFVSAILLMMISVSQAWGADTHTQKQSFNKRFDQGLLWQIDANGVEPSYLFGTIHSDDPLVNKLPKLVTDKLSASDRFVMEVVMDQQSLRYMSDAIFLPPDQSLQRLLGIRLYDDTREALIRRGMTDEHLDRVRPWLVITMLSMPARQNGKFMDLNLQSLAISLQKQVSALETVAEQIAVFDGLSIGDQVALLDATVRHNQKLDGQLAELTRVYRSRNLRLLEALSRKHYVDDGRVYRRFMRKLLHERNGRMLSRLQPLLTEGKVFIAVGALHLAGESGLLQQLEQAGYRLTPLW